MEVYTEKPNTLHTNAIYRGEIVYWNDQKGFGFVAIPENEKNIFFHISSFAYQQRRPEKGNKVSLIIEKESDKIQVSRMVIQGHENTLFTNIPYDNQKAEPQYIEATIYIILVILFYLILSTISTPIALSSAIISGLTFILYSIDKHAAINNTQRVPEASLYIASLLGGWPGALIARPLLRHKTSKNRFIAFFWMSVVINFFTLYIITLFFSPKLF